VSQTLAIVILSGGLDSATALGIAVEEHGKENVKAISFEYGQKHSVEISCADDLCGHYGVDYAIYPLNPKLFKGGVLTTEAEIKDMRYEDLPSGTMSPTYVPFRNGNLISMSAAYADSKLREEEDTNPQGPTRWSNALLYCGMHSEDAAGFAYADCTPEFLGAMAAAILIGTYQRVRLHALFQHATKAEIIEYGMQIGVPYAMTHSCYRGMRPACGACSTCHARLDAFAEAGYNDPLEYANARA
jgi:7-cyano-7-deazaguanine synthase